MERPTLEAWAATVLRNHAEYYRRHPKGELLQTCMAELPTGDYALIECSWENSAQRNLVLAALRANLPALGCTRYAFWCEAWVVMSPLKDEDIEKTARARELHKHPNRVEVLFTILVDQALPTPLFKMQRIIRGRSGGVRTLVLEDQSAVTGLGGELSELLGKATVQ